MTTVATDPDHVGTRFVAWVHGHLGIDGVRLATPLTQPSNGMTTAVWFVQLAGDGLPPPWRRPLVLRIFPRADEAAAARREGEVIAFAAATGFPAPVPLAIVDDPSSWEIGLPFLVQPRVPGELVLSIVTAKPWRAKRAIDELAALAVALHEIPIAGCPLPTEPALVDRWFEHRGPAIAAAGPEGAAVLARLQALAPMVRTESSVLCHGDFHPLNVLIDIDGSEWRLSLIDWTDAEIGDAHFDVARTMVLFRVAAVAANSPVERATLRLAAPLLARWYGKAYGAAHPVDDARLAFWSAAHLVRGWQQVTDLSATSGSAGTPTAAAAAVPAELAPRLLRMATEELGRLA